MKYIPTILLLAVWFCFLACPAFAAQPVAAGREEAVSALNELGVEELVYAVRGIHRDGHWYANIGYHAVGEGTAAYNNSVPAKLVRHHLKSDFLSINCS
jgi:hypothetical protein